MENTILNLREAERVEITVLVDNYSDVLLQGNRTVIRPLLAKDGLIPKDTLLAEHGLSLMVTVQIDGSMHSIILDTGYTNKAVPHNIKFLDLTLETVEAVVLSHGHMDHVGALKEIIHLTGPSTKVILHPDVFLSRSLQPAEGRRISFPPFPSRGELEDWGAAVVENKDPLLVCRDSILVTGEVPRITPFEHGIPGALIKNNDAFEQDTFKDDQALIINLGKKGLVIISGCAHSGIINSVSYAEKLTGKTKICAVIGGFHLGGSAMQPSIEPTIKEMKKLGVQVISPMHCTGFKAISRFAEEMPDAFILSSVGSRIVL